MYKKDLTLSTLQKLKYHKTKQNQESTQQTICTWAKKCLMINLIIRIRQKYFKLSKCV